MPGPYGVTPAGFVIKPYAQILADKQAAVLAALGNSVDLSPASPMGQLLAILSNDNFALWQLAQTAWNSFDRTQVIGAGLDNLGDLTGTPREGASFTQVLCTLTISAGSAPYPPGSLVCNVPGQSALTFENVSAVASGMISGGVATGVLFQAQTVGATPSINPNTLTQITNPVTGWSAVTNPAAQSQLGANAELDADYAIRQEAEVGVDGHCTQAALLDQLYQLAEDQTPPIEGFFANVIDNDTDAVVDSPITLPPHSLAAIVYDPSSTLTAAQIGAVIYANKPAGIPTVGTTAAQVQDPVLGPQTVFYTPVAGVPVYVTALIVIRTGFAFADVEAAVQTALLAASVARTSPLFVPGGYVIASQLIAVIARVPGVYDVQLIAQGLAPNPSLQAPLPTAINQIASFVGAAQQPQIVILQGTAP